MLGAADRDRFPGEFVDRVDRPAHFLVEQSERAGSRTDQSDLYGLGHGEGGAKRRRRETARGGAPEHPAAADSLAHLSPLRPRPIRRSIGPIKPASEQASSPGNRRRAETP